MRILSVLAAVALLLPGFAAEKKVAVFVQNKSRNADIQSEVAGIKERLVAAFSEVEGFQVIDTALSEAAFDQSPNVAAMIGADYVAVASVVGASSMNRSIGDKPAKVFTLRMTLKVMDSNGRGVDGMPMWSRQLPILEAADEPLTYYQMLIDQWATEATQVIATKAVKWRSPSAAESVAFTVSTTVDNVKEALESQTKGVKGEQLQELRKVVGGASVELDGVLVGTAPCEIRATAGLHKIRVTRQWMKPYEATVSVSAGQRLEIALELNDEGVAKWGTIEAIRASVAEGYAEAAWRRGIKMNIDTKAWRDVGVGTRDRTQINNINQK